MGFKINFDPPNKGKKTPGNQRKDLETVLKDSVSHVQRIFSQAKKPGRDPDAPPEPRRTQARSISEGPAPVEESRTKRLDRELREGRELYTPLLQMTVDILSLETREERAAMLLNNWENTLTQLGYEVLREEFLNCKSKYSKAGAGAVLERWLGTLEFFGVKQKYAGADLITVSVENRGDFSNGYEFQDGQRCRIARRPWIYRETVLKLGELAPEGGERESPPEERAPEDAPSAGTPEGDEDVPAPEGVPETPPEGPSEEDPVQDGGSREAYPIPDENSSDFSVAGCCSRGVAAADADTYVCEIIFAYCQKDMCAQCPTVYASSRAAELEALEARVERAAQRAAARGYRRFHVCLIGGDSFSAWGRLSAFGEWLWGREWGLEARLTVTLCSTELTREMRLWLLRHKDRVRVAFRYNGALGRRLWESEKLLRHELTDTVLLCVTTETLPELGRLLTEFASSGKRVGLELLDAGKWSGGEMETYISEVARAELKYLNARGVPLPLISPRPCAGPGGRNIVALDTDGTEYPCRYCSPERALYSVARDRAGRFMESGNGCEAWRLRRETRPELARISELNAGLCERLEKVAETIGSPAAGGTEEP